MAEMIHQLNRAQHYAGFKSIPFIMTLNYIRLSVSIIEDITPPPMD